MKKKPSTPRSKVRAILRQLSLRSRERAAALKRDKYSCQKCGVKQSKAKGREVKVEVHHKSGRIDFEPIIDMIFERLLVPPDEWITYCPNCHKEEHEHLPQRQP
jgi:5-methylcytosine-specific restriction endonuclease McrA